MAITWEARRLMHERAMDLRFIAEQRVLAQAIVPLLLRAANARSENGDPVIPDTRASRLALKEAIWSQVLKPYFIGRGDDPFREAEPLSPFARLLREGIAGAVRIQARRQAALLNRIVRDEAVVQWLTGPRPPFVIAEQRGVYDPFHLWVDPNGYRLSDRIWQVGIQQRAAIDGMLSYHISQGTSAVRMAELLEQYLIPGMGGRTRTPYGREGSYAARRLARTEISAASGRGTVNAAIANPYTTGVQWRLSAQHAGRVDECDFNAAGGPNNDGIYPPDRVPRYPAHPNEMCSLVPVATGDVAQLTADLRRNIAARSPLAQAVQGIVSPQWLTQAILGGFIHEAIERIHRALRGETTARVGVGG